MHFNFDSPAAVSLHFFTHSKNNYGDKQFWWLWQNFDLEICLRIRANLIQFLDTEMKSTWWKQGKVYSFLFIERPNLPSFASRSEITLKTTSQKHTSWMLHYLIATWASSSILKICGEFFAVRLALFQHEALLNDLSNTARLIEILLPERHLARKSNWNFN